MNDFIESLLEQKPHYDEEILGLKNEIANILLCLDPLDVMLHSMWYARTLCFLFYSQCEGPSKGDSRSEPLTELELNNAHIIPELLQSMLTALPRDKVARLDDSKAIENAHIRLFDKCEELVRQCNYHKFFEFAEVEASFDGSQNESRVAIKAFQEESSSYQALRGKRYQLLEEEYLSNLLSGQDELIHEIYGVSSSDIVKGAIALRDSLCLGWNNAMHRFDEVFEEWQSIDQSNPDSINALKDNHDARDISEKLFGSSLHDVWKITGWPAELIEDLSLPAFPESGSESLAYGINPVGIMPIRNYPFITIGEKAYCFCYANLMDNFYRAFYAAMRHRNDLRTGKTEEAFISEWKENQAESSESAVATLFGKLLPGAGIYRNVFHPKEGVTFSRRKASQESDIIVAFDDCVLAVEVKAGAYCPTDPMEDPEGHIKAFKSLIEKASKQAAATIDYLCRCDPKAKLYDKDGHAVASIDMSSIRECFRICVTVDDINEFATRAEKLPFIDVEPGTIAISIDDLLAFNRYFDNPLVFLHFLMQRRRASEHKRIAFNDELDHLGMYIENNCYSVTIDDMLNEHESKCGQLNMVVYDGCRDELNKWFDGLFTGVNGEKPVQPSPEGFHQLVDALGNSGIPNRRLVACSLLDLGSEERSMITESMRARASSLTPLNCILCLPGLSSGGVTKICLFGCLLGRPNDESIMRAKTAATLLSSSCLDAIAMNFVYHSPREIADVTSFYLRRSDLTDSERREAEKYIESVIRAQSSAYRRKYGHKPGRNDPCPCGSGKKYKKCCLGKGLYE